VVAWASLPGIVISAAGRVPVGPSGHLFPPFAYILSASRAADFMSERENAPKFTM